MFFYVILSFLHWLTPTGQVRPNTETLSTPVRVFFIHACWSVGLHLVLRQDDKATSSVTLTTPPCVWQASSVTRAQSSVHSITGMTHVYCFLLLFKHCIPNERSNQTVLIHNQKYRSVKVLLTPRAQRTSFWTYMTRHVSSWRSVCSFKCHWSILFLLVLWHALGSAHLSGTPNHYRLFLFSSWICNGVQRKQAFYSIWSFSFDFILLNLMHCWSWYWPKSAGFICGI